MSDRKIDDYHVLVAKSLTDLEAFVKSSVRVGWEPVGGVTVHTMPANSLTYFYQAMIRYETPYRE